jgi:hypothetical protein
MLPFKRHQIDAVDLFFKHQHKIILFEGKLLLFKSSLGRTKPIQQQSIC